VGEIAARPGEESDGGAPEVSADEAATLVQPTSEPAEQPGSEVTDPADDAVAASTGEVEAAQVDAEPSAAQRAAAQAAADLAAVKQWAADRAAAERAAGEAAEQAAAAQAAADQAAGQAQSSLAQLQQQQKQLQDQADQYQADFERLTAAQQAQVTTALAGPTLSAPDPDSIAAPTEAVAVAIKTALVELGKPYVYGAAGPNGFDCSGLTMFAYAAAGVSLPHSSAAQSRMGTAVSRADLQPGDLVYFYSPVSHVGLYIGDGKMVHARTFGSPVAVTSVDMSGYAGARRIVGG
jgi:peptidoglycan DL-endopeptidase CwlO